MTPEEKKIEEVANNHCLYERGNCDEDDRLCNLSDHMFVIGAKSDAAKEYWQKGMYTEEEVLLLLKRVGKEISYPETYYEPSDTDENNDKYFDSEIEDWFNQNKKKE